MDRLQDNRPLGTDMSKAPTPPTWEQETERDAVVCSHFVSFSLVSCSCCRRSGGLVHVCAQGPVVHGGWIVSINPVNKLTLNYP